MEMIRGRTRPIEMAQAGLVRPVKAEAKLDMSIHNRFDIEVVDAFTGKTKQKAYAENVICNRLWTRMFNATPFYRKWNNYIHYGSGAGTPSASDTSLFAFVGAVANSGLTRNFDSAAGVASVRHQIQLSETTAVGVTITEVGIGYESDSSTLCTHAMLKDMNGNPISIVKTDTDIINIFATIFVHYNPEGYDSGTIRIALPSASESVSNDLIDWLFGLQWNVFYDYAGAGRGGWAVSTGSGVGSWSFTFNSTTKTFKAVLSRRNVSTWNQTGGLSSINACGVNGYNIFLGFKAGGSWYPGSTIVGEAVGTGDGVTKDFKTAFGDVSDAIIYVDGTPASSVTVDESPYYSDQAGTYFERLDENGKVHFSPSTPGSGGTISDGTTYTFFNPYYSFGIQTFTKTGAVKVEVSDDLEAWTEILSGQSGTVSVPSEYQNAKYWRFTNASGYNENLRNFVIAPTNNIHFDSAPPNGAVITADYFTKTIAKDSNHVFDFECTITVGEKTT